MNGKPSYLGLLNAIAVGEARAFRLFKAWRKRTRDQELGKVLNLVAIREREHAGAFTKRLAELGYDVRRKDSDEFDERLALIKSKAKDLQKFEEVLGYGRTVAAKSDEGSLPRADSLSRLFDDKTIDPQTGALLGRFIAEERDTTRLLQAQYDRLARSDQD